MKKTYSVNFLRQGGLSEKEVKKWKRILDVMDRKDARFWKKIKEHELTGHDK